MEFVVKITKRCNFACKYCSSTCLGQTTDLPFETLKPYLDRFKDEAHKDRENNLILNGGDPLMIDPSYYMKVINYIKENNIPAHICFVSNMWDYYKNPEKWKEVFSEDCVSLSMSFEYGGQRIPAGSNKPIDENYFLEVWNRIYKEYDYKISFISVIGEETAPYALKNVELAKRLDTEVKMNAMVKLGRASSYFPMYKMIDIYMDIIKAGLQDYEYNCRQVAKIIKGIPSFSCGYNRECFKGLRCLHPDGKLFNCGWFADENIQDGGIYEIPDYEKPIDFSKTKYFAIKPECLACPMFTLCNGCFKRIRDIKESGDAEIHCQEMKKRMKEIYKVFGEAEFKDIKRCD